ncbi:MAG: tetratricopeptide repeat-containing sensor histidine kinase [Colwellia sp.]|nr:tetratricopeptide repeat-containing sensor histidine kinase [Colwellia sp.]
MRAIVVVALLNALVVAFGINAESVTQLTKEEFSALRSEVLNTRATSPDRAISRVEEILVQYKDALNTRQTLRLTYAKALFQIGTDQFEDAYATLTQCKKLADELNEPYLTHYYYSYMGSNFGGLEMYELSLENYLKSYQLAVETKDESLISKSYNNIGHVLLKLYRLDEAKSYFEKFYLYGVDNNVQSYIAVGLNNLGDVAFEQGNTTLALQNFTESLAIREKENYVLNSSWSHHNLGKVHLQLENYKKANEHLNQAIDIREKYGSRIESLFSKIILAKVYLAQKNDQAAIPLLKSVIKAASDINNYSAYTQAYEVLNHYYKGKGDFVKAIDASEHFTASQLQLTERKANLGLSHYIAISDLALKEIDIIELKKKNEIISERADLARTKIILLLVSSAIIAFIVLFFFIKINNKNKQLKQTISMLNMTQKELIEADKMSAMTTLVSGMAHQLNTPLSVIITANSIMKDKVQQLEDKLINKNLGVHSFKAFIEDAKQTISLSENNSKKAADLVRRFKMISAELEGYKLTSFQLKQFMHKKLFLLAGQYQQRLSYDIEGYEVEIFNYPDVLFNVLEQLVKNTFDHQSEDMSEIKSIITIKSLDNRVEVIYVDNGPGIDEELRQKIFNPFFTTKGMQESLGLGLNVAYNSVLHLMQGKFSCEPSSAGAKFIINLPLKIDTDTG